MTPRCYRKELQSKVQSQANLQQQKNEKRIARWYWDKSLNVSRSLLRKPRLQRLWSSRLRDIGVVKLCSSNCSKGLLCVVSIFQEALVIFFFFFQFLDLCANEAYSVVSPQTQRYVSICSLLVLAHFILSPRGCGTLRAARVLLARTCAVKLSLPSAMSRASTQRTLYSASLGYSLLS